METLHDLDVVRAIGLGMELRTLDGQSGLGTLAIRFSRFNTWYEVSSYWEGDFLERTLPGTFTQTIHEDRANMRVLFNHGFDMSTGDKVLGQIDDLREDADSPVGEVSLFDTSYNRDLLPGLRAGVYGSSMRMRVQADSWDDEPQPSEYNPKGIPERSITRAKVMEFGPVTFPANPDSTAEMASAAVRSTTDQFYGQLEKRDRGAFDAAVRAAGRNPTDLTGRVGARSAAGGGSKDDGPGHGATSTRSPSLARHHELILKGIIR